MDHNMRIVRISDQSTAPRAAEIVGAKAANLTRMAALGLPVPPAFVLPIELCAAAARGDGGVNDALADGLMAGIAVMIAVCAMAFQYALMRLALPKVEVSMSK